jgi:hypothetical protein
MMAAYITMQTAQKHKEVFKNCRLQQLFENYGVFFNFQKLLFSDALIGFHHVMGTTTPHAQWANSKTSALRFENLLWLPS